MNRMPKPGKVEQYIHNKLERDGAILLSLIDPDKQPLEKGAKMAQECCEAGADIILVGGTIGAQGIILDKTAKMIREKANVPIVLFNGHVTPYADAMYFMYILNSRDTYWISTGQIAVAPVVKKMGIEPIPTAYIILEPGRAVGWVSNANMIPRDRPDIAAANALAAQYMGVRLVVTDSGSGAPDPAPLELIKAVRSVIEVPYFYAGGCRTPEQAGAIIKAGADGIHIGTAFELEEGKDVKEKVKKMVAAVKEAGREKIKNGNIEEKVKSFLPMVKVSRIFHLPSFGKAKESQKEAEKKDDIKPLYDISSIKERLYKTKEDYRKYISKKN